MLHSRLDTTHHWHTIKRKKRKWTVKSFHVPVIGTCSLTHKHTPISRVNNSSPLTGAPSLTNTQQLAELIIPLLLANILD
jgi:hypothetical protein